jgi:type I restriction enzyme S subunit
MRIRTTAEIDSAFLAMQMCAPAFRRQLEKAKRATTSVAAIYLKDLVRLQVIVPAMAEQHRIVAEVDRRLSIVREVEAEVDANLKRAQALRKAVLGRAFAGPIQTN